MTRYFITWLAVTVSFLAIDAVWLSYVAKDFYRRHLDGMLLDEFRLGIAALFYLLYAVGILVLAVAPAAKAGSPLQAILLGALFGACAYGTYDITNLATLKNWPVIVSVVDIAWGTVLTATASFVGYLVLSRLG